MILAGITITQLSGSGLFEKAKLAKEKYQNTQDDEEDKIAKYNNEINSYLNGNRDYTPISYSTEEQDTGLKWVNGKELYQKSYNIKVSPTSTDVNIDEKLKKNNIIPIETDGYIKIDNGNYINAGYASGVNFIIQENGFHCNTSGQYNITEIFVTIRYNKIEE